MAADVLAQGEQLALGREQAGRVEAAGLVEGALGGTEQVRQGEDHRRGHDRARPGSARCGRRPRRSRPCRRSRTTRSRRNAARRPATSSNGRARRTMIVSSGWFSAAGSPTVVRITSGPSMRPSVRRKPIAELGLVPRRPHRHRHRDRFLAGTGGTDLERLLADDPVAADLERAAADRHDPGRGDVAGRGRERIHGRKCRSRGPRCRAAANGARSARAARAVRRSRSGELPGDRARVAVVERPAQPAGQVPGPARDVRPAVHDRDRDRPAVRGVPERDLRAARQRPVGDADGATPSSRSRRPSACRRTPARTTRRCRRSATGGSRRPGVGVRLDRVGVGPAWRAADARSGSTRIEASAERTYRPVRRIECQSRRRLPVDPRSAHRVKERGVDRCGRARPWIRRIRGRRPRRTRR